MFRGNCSNCGRPRGPSSAHGLDTRCYQYKRRYGILPPAQLLKKPLASGGVGSVKISFDIDRKAFSDARYLATGKKQKLAEWLRELVRLEIARSGNG